jgi:hypothetical protein
MAKNKLLRMDNVGIVVESLDDTISFFAELAFGYLRVMFAVEDIV